MRNILLIIAILAFASCQHSRVWIVAVHQGGGVVGVKGSHKPDFKQKLRNTADRICGKSNSPFDVLSAKGGSRPNYIDSYGNVYSDHWVEMEIKCLEPTARKQPTVDDMERLCGPDNPEACATAGRMHYAAHDTIKAREFHGLACKYGDDYSCKYMQLIEPSVGH